MKLSGLILIQIICVAQTTVNLGRQGVNADFSNFSYTFPFKIGTTLPSTCTVGMSFYKTNATAGQNIYGCTATNTWTVQSGSGGSSPGAPDNSLQYRVNSTTLGGMLYWDNDATNKTLSYTLIPDPTTHLTVALAGAGAGNVNNSDHCYAYAYYVNGNYYLMTFTAGYDLITVTDNTVNGKVSISNIPVSSDPRTYGRVLFRTTAGQDCSDDTKFKFLAMIADNTTTTYTDNIADSSLGSVPVYFNALNATGSVTIAGNSVPITSSGPILQYSTSNSEGLHYTASTGLTTAFPSGSGVFANDGFGNYSWNPSGNILTGSTGSIGGSLLTALSCTSGTATVTGVTTGMTIAVTPVTYPGDDFTWQAYVSGTDTVTVKLCSLATLTPTASVYNVRVIP